MHFERKQVLLTLIVILLLSVVTALLLNYLVTLSPGLILFVLFVIVFAAFAGNYLYFIKLNNIIARSIRNIESTLDLSPVLKNHKHGQSKFKVLDRLSK
ncbi:MAG TPA: hypothetical protein DCS67_00450, partial [Clostridiales bacterium UBA8960]|nr:hypothetical protein [Clostridiales bacterium UBA8960]